MSATAYTLTTAGTGLDRCAQTVTVTPTGGTYTGTITLTTVGADPASTVLTFSSSSAAQTFSVTPKLGQAGGTVTITGTNSGSLTDPAPATSTVALRPKRRRGVNNGGGFLSI